MDRRGFLQLAGVGAVAAGGTTAAATGVAAAAECTHVVTFTVRGFSCETCAVGLDVILGREPGVVRSRSSHPSGEVAVGYDATLTTPGTLGARIAETGFSVVGTSVEKLGRRG